MSMEAPKNLVESDLSNEYDEYYTGVVMKNSYCPNLKKMPLAAIFDALSDPARLEIIITLLDEEEISCGQCTSTLSKSTMSHHFKVLRETGLIKRREEGKVHFISLRIKELEERLPGITSMLKKLKAPF